LGRRLFSHIQREKLVSPNPCWKVIFPNTHEDQISLNGFRSTVHYNEK
jgi:hypothetical protein